MAINRMSTIRSTCSCSKWCKMEEAHWGYPRRDRELPSHWMISSTHTLSAVSSIPKKSRSLNFSRINYSTMLKTIHLAKLESTAKLASTHRTWSKWNKIVTSEIALAARKSCLALAPTSKTSSFSAEWQARYTFATHSPWMQHRLTCLMHRISAHYCVNWIILHCQDWYKRTKRVTMCTWLWPLMPIRLRQKALREGHLTSGLSAIEASFKSFFWGEATRKATARLVLRTLQRHNQVPSPEA